MNEISCLIVDDEELARALLENYSNRLPYLRIIGKCSNPIEALEVLQNNSIDLMFLDIQMPEMIGTDFLKTLSQKPLVIFTTAYAKYALESYELSVVDYLLKPFSFERFVQAVNKANDLIKLKQSSTNTIVLAAEKTSISEKYILVKSEHKIYRILFKDIRYVQSMREYVAYHTPAGRILSLGSLKSLGFELPENQFMRVHKSYIVNKGKVSTLEGNMIHIGKDKIPIGASYRERVLKELF